MRLLSHPGAGWHIRAARRSDQSGIEDVFATCLKAFPWRGSLGDELIRLRRTAQSCLFLVAEEQKAGVIGFLTLEKPKAYIPHLFVAPDWRLCGIGRGLLCVGRTEAGKSLSLDVDVKNKAAIKAYLSMGWVEHARVGCDPQVQLRLIGP